MEFLKPALLYTALSCGVLAGSFLYVWLAYGRRRYALYWALSWFAAVPHLACTWLMIGSPASAGLQIADQLLLVANSFLMLLGCYDFVYRRAPVKPLVLIALPFIAWGILAPQSSAAFANMQIPNAFLLGGSYLWTAVIFFHLHRTRRQRGTLIVAILFALAGLHEFDYPLFGNVPWAASVGYTIASVLAMTIALSLLILIVEESRADVDQQRARLHGVLEALPVGVVMFDPSGTLAFDNQAARALLGGSAPDEPLTVAGLAARLLPPLEGAQQPVGEAPMIRSLRSGEACTPEEYSVVDAHAARRAVLINAAPVHDARDRLLGMVTVLQDVDELKHIEREMRRTERLRALGTLAAGVAHDFNNNLMLIQGHAQLALLRGLEGAGRTRVEAISRIATESVGIVSRIQDLARARPVGAVPATAFDLSVLAHDVVELARPRWGEGAEASGIHYVVETRLQKDVVISGQAGDLREAILNLVINALDAMPAGGRLQLTVAAEGEEARLIIQDSGDGMPPDVRERIFDPFFSTKGSRGTGLGLSLVFGVVERHGGRIDVQTAPGAGTTFTLYFARTKSATPAATAGAETPAIELASRHVLVVDDQKAVLEITVEMIEAQGHRATAAESSEAALRLIEEREFDVVFTDLVMPDVTGWEIVAHAARVRPGLPVYLVTGWGQTLSADECEKRGAAGVIAKPYLLEDLAAAIEKTSPPKSRAA